MSANPFTAIQSISTATQGLQDVLGRLPAASFWAQLQPASYGGVRFSVLEAESRFGRRNAMHEYPYRDIPWIEDMGRGARRFRVTGFLVGDDVIAQRNALLKVVEAPGDGKLVHPTLGERTVALIDFSCTERFDKGRYFELAFSFAEQGRRVYPNGGSDAKAAIGTSADDLNASAIKTFVDKTLKALSGGAAVLNQMAQAAAERAALAQQTLQDVASVINIASTLPGAITGAVASVPAYASSNPVTASIGASFSTLTAQSSASRVAVQSAFRSFTLASSSISASTATSVGSSAQAAMASLRQYAPAPKDAIRALINVAAYSTAGSYPNTPTGTRVALGLTAMNGLLSLAALAELARASSAYSPTSSDDAAQVRTQVVDAIDAQIEIAGNQGDDAVYISLRALRTQVARDLGARGAALPGLVDIVLQAPMPSLVLAQRLYQDASRAGELASEAACIHPAFMPLSFKALSA